MIIYVNIDKQTGNITVNNDNYPDDPTMLVVNSGTIVDNSNNTNFEISFEVTRFQELEPPMYPEHYPQQEI
jgi:hypothetical protein